MKKLRCPFPLCAKSYRSQFTQRRHLEAFHYRTKRFTCLLCEKSFAYGHTLCKHDRRVHPNTLISATQIPLLTSLLHFCQDPDFKPVCKSLEKPQALRVRRLWLPH